MKPKYLNDKDPWILAEDIPDCDLFFSRIWLWCFVNDFRRQAGCAYKKLISVYRGYHLWFYYGEKDSFLVGEALAEKFLRNPRFTITVNRECIKWYKEIMALGRSIPVKMLKKLSNGQLLEHYRRHQKIHHRGYRWGWTPVAVDMFHNNLTSRLQKYLRGLGVPEEKVSAYFVLLTQPLRKSPIQIEQESFLKIAAKVQKNGKANIGKDLRVHYKKYFFTKYLFIGSQGVYDLDYYRQEIKRILKEGSPTRQLFGIQNKFKQDLRARKRLLNELNITNPWRTILDNWGEFMVTKIYRRFGQILLLYRMEFVLREVARRFGLSLMQMRFMLPREVEKMFKTGKIPSDLAERTKFCVYYGERGFEKVFTGKAAESLAKKTKRRVNLNLSKLAGQTGCGGYGKGRVKIIIRASDMKKFRKGDILVSIATDPDIVPAMKKAAAIVTEQGGITSHAAIVSRELGIPCVIGTKIATKVLKDGDLVEVDANKGIVRKL